MVVLVEDILEEDSHLVVVGIPVEDIHLVEGIHLVEDIHLVVEDSLELLEEHLVVGEQRCKRVVGRKTSWRI
jgi:hypothetical protein